MNRILGLALFAFLALAVAALTVGCDGGKGTTIVDNYYPDDDFSPDDDDSWSDDDSSPDDDVSPDDDASPTAPPTCQSVYDEFYLACGFAFHDPSGNAIPESVIVAACAANFDGAGLTGRVAQCIIDHAGDCAAISACVHGQADDDDDTAPAAECAQIAQDVAGTCQVTLKDDQGNSVDQAGMVDWCTLSDELFPSAKASPFWLCMDNCAVAQFCDQACFNGCISPSDPGGTGCAHTVYEIYSCGVLFVFANTNYYVPEMDEMASCPSDTTNDWACFAICAADNPCSSPPTEAQSDAIINCLNSCYGPDDDDDTGPYDDDNDTRPYDDDSWPDDDDDTWPDDDDDTWPDDDDDTAPIDDDASPTSQCVQIAQDVVGTCQITLEDIKGNPVGQAGMADWCTLSEELFPDATASPFWACMDNCAVAQFCSQTCFDGCISPSDPGGTGCGHTVYEIYSCDIVFEINNTNYWAPEMDEIAVCPTDTTTNWSCYATCATNNPCSSPPTSAQELALINCMDAC